MGIYIYQERKWQEKFDSGHTVAIKTALNFINQENINEFINYYEQYEYLANLFNENIDTKEDFDNFVNLIDFTTSFKEKMDSGIKYHRDKNNPQNYFFENDDFPYCQIHLDRYKTLKQKGGIS